MSNLKRRKKDENIQDRKPLTIAYLRVSTNDQDTEKNKDQILRFVNERDFGKVDFIEEKVTGTTPWRQRKIGEIIERLGKGDRLIVPELSRLGRSMLDIMEILKIAKDKEIDVFAIKGNWALNGGMQSKIIAMVFAMAAEIEKDLISSRTKEGLKARKAAGVTLGRPKGPGKSKLDQYRPEIEALLKNGSTKVFIANRYGTTPANLINWIKKKSVGK